MAANSEDDILTLDEASEVLGVPVEQVQAMAEEGLLTPADEGDPTRFRRADVEAARLAGG